MYDLRTELFRFLHTVQVYELFMFFGLDRHY